MKSVAGLFLQEVCSQYWPETGGVTTFGEYTIDNLGEESFPGFTVRQLSVLDKKVGCMLYNHMSECWVVSKDDSSLHSLPVCH